MVPLFYNHLCIKLLFCHEQWLIQESLEELSKNYVHPEEYWRWGSNPINSWKLSIRFPLTALIYKICRRWHTFTNSRLAANCLSAGTTCLWQPCSLWPTFSRSVFQRGFYWRLFHLPYSSEPPQIILSSPFSCISKLLYFSANSSGWVGKSRVTIPDPLQASPGPGAAQKCVKAVGTIWGRDLCWYQKITTIFTSNI